MKKELHDRIKKFTNDRDWHQFHTGKDLALSLSLESSELLEVYQWSGKDLECTEKLEKIREELADVFIYATMIADNYGLDVNEIIEAKMTANEIKYPVALSKGNNLKYTAYKKSKK